METCPAVGFVAHCVNTYVGSAYGSQGDGMEWIVGMGVLWMVGALVWLCHRQPGWG
jgi:hypothetical protein